MGMSQKMIVYLDGGHGRETAGKSATVTESLKSENFAGGYYSKVVPKMYENEFNDAIVNKVSAYLYAAKQSNRLDLDVYIVSAEFDDVDNGERVRRANAIYDQYPNAKHLYLSIHCDAFTNEAANGFTIYAHTQASEKTLSFAQKLLPVLTENHKKFGIISRGVRTAGFEVLRETKMPAILIESGFMTNQKDLNTLLNDSFRNEYAACLSRWVVGL